MKTTQTVLILVIIQILMGSLVSCNDRTHSQAQLDRAERFMFEQPDSALQILENEVNPQQLSARQQADWAILLTQARDRNYIEQTSDSLIRVGIDYYEKHEDTERLMTAYYYHGIYYMDEGDALRAQERFLKALSLSENTDDVAMKARICSNLGHVYLFQNLYREAIPNLNRAKNYFLQLDDSANLAIALRDLARVYSVEEQPDSVIFYYEQALNFANEVEKPFILNEIGSSYCRNNDIIKAKFYLDSAFSYDFDDEEFASICLTRANYFLKAGLNDSAKFYFTKALNSERPAVLTGVYKGLATIAKKAKDWETAVRYQELSENASAKQLAEKHTQEMQRVQALYTYRIKENEVKELQLAKATAQRNSLILSLSLVLLSILLVGVLYYYFRRKKEIRTKRDQYLREFTEKRFEISAEQIKENRERIETLKQYKPKPIEDESLQVEVNLLECVNKFITQTLAGKDEATVKLKDSALYQQIQDGSITHLSQQQLKDACAHIVALFPKLMAAAEAKASTKLTVTDLETISMLKMGFRTGQMAELLNLSPNGVSTRLRRLTDKLFGEEVDTATLLAFIKDH